METKTALVTGSSSGIGFAVAKRFLDAGWNVVLNGRDAARLNGAAQALGHRERLASVAGSTNDPATGEAMAKTALERFGGVDALVNNAGEFGFKPFLQVGEKDLDHYYAVNLKGTFLVTQAAVRDMAARKRGGSIVNIGTVLAEHGMSWATASAPLAAKGGVHALTVALAAELASLKIRVNCVAPGFVRTRLTEGADDKALSGSALLGRVGEAQEIASAVLYLSDASFVTGRILDVDGGFVGGRA
jgi:NAD(P)-dependent dehydrogenase (short-subunit alcohol dehydrogenase family)